MRKIPFCENVLHTQQNVAYATCKCCICNILLRMQHTDVAYATKCCICNTKMQMSQMQQDVRYAAYMCCKCNKMFGILITCTVLVTYLVICLKTTWLSKSSILSSSLQSYYQNKKIDIVHKNIFFLFFSS